MPGDFFRVALEQGVLTMVDLQCLKTCINRTTDMDPSRFHVKHPAIDHPRHAERASTRSVPEGHRERHLLH